MRDIEWAQRRPPKPGGEKSLPPIVTSAALEETGGAVRLK